MGADAIHFNLIDINHAVQLLSLIEKSSQDDGSVSINADDLFASDGSFLSSQLDGRPLDPSHAISILQMMKSLSATFSNITNMVENAIPQLSEELIPNVHQSGMASLPNEICVNIFESAFDLAERDRNMVTNCLLRVCRRYRDLVLRTSKLWTFMNFKAGCYININLHLTLSRNKPLAVEIDCDSFSSVEDLKEIMDSVVLGAGRLEELTIYAMYERPHTKRFLTHLRRAYKKVEFQSLKTLRLEYWAPEWCLYDVHHVPEGLEAKEESRKMFFSGWRIPSLRELALSNHIPTKPFTWASQITSLHLSFGSDYSISDGDITYWDTSSILNFLQKCKSFESLEELSIKILQLDLSSTTSRESRVTLPSVKRLSLHSALCTSDSFTNLAKSLEFLNLEELNLRFSASAEDISDWLQPFLSRKTYGAGIVSHISLDIEVEEIACQGIDEFLEYYRDGLDYLHLKGNLTLPELHVGRALKMLRIEDSSRIDRNFLDNLPYSFEYKSGRINSIEFINCPFIDEDDVRGTIRKWNELVWRSDSKVLVINGHREQHEPSESLSSEETWAGGALARFRLSPDISQAEESSDVE